jgi:hypothetical protein
MNTDNIKFLRFRSDLIELLRKYKYEISGSGFDDGSMNIVGANVSYNLNSAVSDYEAFDNDWVSISDEYIIEAFPVEVNIAFPLNKNVGIFTNSTSKATKIFDDLYDKNIKEIERRIDSNDQKLLLLKNGTRFTWIRLSDNSRGHRCSGAYIDKNITLSEFQYIVGPICVYCARSDIEII